VFFFSFVFQPVGGSACFTKSLTPRTVPGALFELCAYCKGTWGRWIIIFRQLGQYLEADTLTGTGGPIVGIEERQKHLLRGYFHLLSSIYQQKPFMKVTHCIAQCHVLQAAHSHFSSYNPDHSNALVQFNDGDQ
jgi:hypothetical protein